MSFRNFVDKIKRYFWFQKDELSGFLITVFVVAFIFSFTDWGTDKFDVVVGISNLSVAVFIVAISIFVHHAVQRLVALWYGFRAEHILWWQGLTVSSLLAIFSNGKIKLLPGSALMIHHLPIHRLGAYRYGPGLKAFSTISALGPFANLVFSTIVRVIGDVFFPNNVFFLKLYSFNLLFAAYNLLPIPPLDGSRIFYESRLMYVFVFCAILGYVILDLVVGLRSYILALVIGVISWFVFYYYFERAWS